VNPTEWIRTGRGRGRKDSFGSNKSFLGRRRRPKDKKCSADHTKIIKKKPTHLSHGLKKVGQKRRLWEGEGSVLRGHKHDRTTDVSGTRGSGFSDIGDEKVE